MATSNANRWQSRCLLYFFLALVGDDTLDTTREKKPTNKPTNESVGG
jgi:hypothetical protein